MYRFIHNGMGRQKLAFAWRIAWGPSRQHLLGAGTVGELLGHLPDGASGVRAVGSKGWVTVGWRLLGAGTVGGCLDTFRLVPLVREPFDQRAGSPAQFWYCLGGA